jgi:hypothetical protein
VVSLRVQTVPENRGKKIILKMEQILENLEWIPRMTLPEEKGGDFGFLFVFDKGKNFLRKEIQNEKKSSPREEKDREIETDKLVLYIFCQGAMIEGEYKAKRGTSTNQGILLTR